MPYQLPTTLPSGTSFNNEQYKKRTLNDVSKVRVDDSELQMSKQKKKKMKKPWKWRKPVDKPKRPLSSYNLFFISERDRLVAERKAEATALLPSHLPASAHKQKNWLSGKRNMAKEIAEKWNVLDDVLRSVYEERALKLKEQYFIDLERWKKSKGQEKEKDSQSSTKKDLSSCAEMDCSLAKCTKMSERNGITTTMSPTNSLLHQMQFSIYQNEPNNDKPSAQLYPLISSSLPVFPPLSPTTISAIKSTTPPFISDTSISTGHERRLQNLDSMLDGLFDDDDASNFKRNTMKGSNAFNNTSANTFPTFDGDVTNHKISDAVINSNDLHNHGCDNTVDDDEGYNEEFSLLLKILSQSSESPEDCDGNTVSPQPTYVDNLLEKSLELFERSKELCALSSLDNDESHAFLSSLDFST